MVKRNAGICTADGCDRSEYALDLCTMHYQRYRRTGTTDLREKEPKRICSVEGCNTVERRASGLCVMHYTRMIRRRQKDESEGHPPLPMVFPKLKPLPADHPMRAALALPTEGERIDALLALRGA